jgi:capsular exopolysaccharide synthesis family protein
MGQRVLIVDADMRRPQLHQCLGLNNMRGLSNVLASGVDPDQVIQTVDPNLSVLTAGQIPPDPTKLLSSNRMKQLIDQFKDTYDLVLYDTPPLLGLADGSLLAGYLDGVVLVVGLGKTNRQSIKSVIDNLKVSSVPILGIVANGLTHSATYNTDYYYQHYQSYYYSAAKREPIES